MMDMKMKALADMAGAPQGGGMVDAMMKAPAPKGPEALEAPVAEDPTVAAISALEALIDAPSVPPDAKALVMELLSKLGAKGPQEKPDAEEAPVEEEVEA